jgi:hypothetical protein
MFEALWDLQASLPVGLVVRQFPFSPAHVEMKSSPVELEIS